jgi:hypothetical protein
VRQKPENQEIPYITVNLPDSILGASLMNEKNEEERPPTPEQLKKDREIIAKLQNKRKEELKQTEIEKAADKKKTEALFEKRFKKAK